MLLAPPIGVSLPILKELSDTGLIDLTVTTFIPQLYELPSRVVESAQSLDALQALYVTTNPLILAFAFSLFISPLFLVVSEINKNYSQVDRFWSILPSVYIGHYCLWAHLAGLPTSRMDLLFAISSLWSARLTFNYWRRGGYEIGSEDYRWAIVKANVNPTLFFILNVLFISLAQNVLLFLVTTPVYVLMLASYLQGNDLSLTDALFAALSVSSVVFEFVADQQQWNFQQNKKLYLKTAKIPDGYIKDDLDRGFLVRGLWAWSRHPNFLGEQAFWVSLYEWSSLDTNQYYNWTVIGALSYLLLFQSSTWLTESITAGKYPEYKQYQKRVSKFLPKLATLITGPVQVEKSAKSRVETKEKKTDSRKSR